MKNMFLVLMFAVTIFSVGQLEAKMKSDVATFAGGCFWCVEYPYEDLNGVIDAVSGYTDGEKINPSYAEVSAGITGHAEAVQITYDPDKITYLELLDIFWKQIDPTDKGGQFADRGNQYRPVIFYHNAQQKEWAENSKKQLEESGIFKEPIVVDIVKAGAFYRAEEYHQDYAKKNPTKYKYYKTGSGRTPFLKKTWSENNFSCSVNTEKYPKPDKASLKSKLSEMQYKVTQEEGTEAPFNNAYWDNKKEGIYVDIVSGEPLYSSLDKFKSGTGWPSFTRALESENIVEKEDNNLFMKRIELRSKHGDSHLGHVFDDGPAPTGERHCINSASLRFIAKEDLKKEGYSEYLKLFEE